MSKFKVIYADASEEVLHFAGEAVELFEQLFSHIAQEVRDLCSVEPVEPVEPVASKPAKKK